MNSEAVEVFTKLLTLGARNPSFGLNNILVHGRPGTGKADMVQRILPNTKVVRIENPDRDRDIMTLIHLAFESTEDLIIDIDANIFAYSRSAQSAIRELIDSRFDTPLKTIIVTSIRNFQYMSEPAAHAIAARCVLFNFDQVEA